MVTAKAVARSMERVPFLPRADAGEKSGTKCAERYGPSSYINGRSVAAPSRSPSMKACAPIP